MTHPKQIALWEHDCLQKEIVVQKKDNKAKFEEEMACTNDLVVIEKLCKITGKEVLQDNLKYCSMENFAKHEVFAAKLELFI